MATNEDVLTMLMALDERLRRMELSQKRMEKVVMGLGKANSEAFKQCKVVIEHLTEAVDSTRQDLSEYGGTITASTWDI